MELVPRSDSASIHSLMQGLTRASVPQDLGTYLQWGHLLICFQMAPPEFNIN